MPRAGFETAIPMFERPKTILALDRAAIETGSKFLRSTKYYSGYEIKEDEKGGTCSKHQRDEKCIKYFGLMGEGGGVYRVLVGRPEDKRPLSRPRSRWEDNITLILRMIGINESNWIRLAQDRAFMNSIVNLRFP
jgi:hypothetical protein